jgi:hypothetical protein
MACRRERLDSAFPLKLESAGRVAEPPRISKRRAAQMRNNLQLLQFLGILAREAKVRDVCAYFHSVQ